MSVTPSLQKELDEAFDFAVLRAMERFTGDLEFEDLPRLVREELTASTVSHSLLPPYYKVKGRNGEGHPNPDNPLAITPFNEICTLPRGPGGWTDVPLNRYQGARVLRAFWEAGDYGLIDKELEEKSGVYEHSAMPLRAKFLGEGWIVDSGRTRLSPVRKEMTVWVLSKGAKALLTERGERWWEA